MPAIGASTTGVSTVPPSRPGAQGQGGRQRTCPHCRPRAGHGRRRERALAAFGAAPDSPVQVIGSHVSVGLEGHGLVGRPVGREVDQADRGRLARARTPSGAPGTGTGRRAPRSSTALDQGVGAVEQVERHLRPAEVGVADVRDRRVHEVGLRPPATASDATSPSKILDRGLPGRGRPEVEHSHEVLPRLPRDASRRPHARARAPGSVGSTPSGTGRYGVVGRGRRPRRGRRTVRGRRVVGRARPERDQRAGAPPARPARDAMRALCTRTRAGGPATARQQPMSRSAKQRVMPSRLTRSWVMVSRSRTVTALSSRVSKSTVTQNGVPISSWRR